MSGKVVKHVERNKNQIADAADVNDHFARQLLRELAADLCDHVEPCKRVNRPSGRSRGFRWAPTLYKNFELWFRRKTEFILFVAI
jgi:hypothetical protein